jgi:chitodextrinase
MKKLIGSPAATLLTALMAAVGVLIAGSAPAATVTTTALEPDADAHVLRTQPDDTFGSGTRLLVDLTPIEMVSYLRFTVPATGTVARATLRLYVADPSHDGPAVVSTGASWSESQLTWNNRPAAGATLADVGAVAAGWLEYDVTSAVTAGGTYGFALVPTSGNGVDFYSRERKDFKPQLVVETVESGASDNTPPTAPSGLAAKADATSVSLTWQASTDAVGVAGYRVYQDGTGVGTVQQTAFTAGSLPCGRPYAFAVEAYDAAGNTSPRASISATTSACATSDTQAPTAPTSFGGSASATSASLSWAASTDNVGVAGYRVYQDGAVVATQQQTAVTIGPLACGKSYGFSVEAFDAAGNVSPRPSLSLPTSACPAPSGATCDRYAAPSGSDTSAGTSSAPFRTAQKLLTSLASGQTGCLRAGVYSSSGTYVLDVARDDVSVQSYPGERAKLLGNLMVRAGSDRVRLSSLDIEGTGGSNTVKVYGTDFLLEGSDVTNAYRGRSCMILGSTTAGAAVRPVIRRNRFHECGAVVNDNKDHAIYVAVTDGGEIVGNVFYNHISRAVQIYPHAKRVLVAHNVIDGGAPSIRGGVVIGSEADDPSSGNVVEYNVIAYAENYNIYTNWNGVAGTGNIVRHNCVWGGKLANLDLTQVSSYGNLVAEPLFVDRAKRDYRLSAASPCLGVVGYDAVRSLG